jgi:hypothetical protein
MKFKDSYICWKLLALVLLPHIYNFPVERVMIKEYLREGALIYQTPTKGQV